METTVFLNGNPMHLVGNLPKVGDDAPYFVLVDKDLKDFNLHDFKGKRVVLNIFPSVDTPVCAASVRRFNQDAAKLENTAVVCVSEDLPFAQARFCASNDIENVYTGSAFRSDFGTDYGIELADGPMRGLLARGVVVIDENGKVIGTSLCEQITTEPDYAFVENLLKK